MSQRPSYGWGVLGAALTREYFGERAIGTAYGVLAIGLKPPRAALRHA